MNILNIFVIQNELGFFVQKDPLPNAIDKKDYLRIKMSKKTPSPVAAGAAGDTCHRPPHQEAAGPAATTGGGRARYNGFGTVQQSRRNG